MSPAKPRCEGRVWGSYTSYQCANKASMTHEGKQFCKTHHPPFVQAKRAARDAELRARIDREINERSLANEASKERDRRAALFPELLEALILMIRTHDEPAETLLQEMKEQKWLEKARAAIAKATGEQA